MKMLCHLVLLAPLFSLALFFIYPLQTAIPIYLTILLFSSLFYRKVIHSMRLPVRAGFEEMIGATAVVVEEIYPEGGILYKGEFWRATSSERLGKGEKVAIVGREGMVLRVERHHL